MQSRGRQPNLSFFAFTATPKGKTLELFGRPGAERQAGGLPHLQHAAGDRGGLHPRRADELHDLRHLLPAAQGGRGRSRAAEEEGGAGAGQVHEPAPAQHRAEDRGDGRALPPQREAPARRAGQGDGGHVVAPARRALHAGVRALHRGERLHRHPAAGGLQRHGARPGDGPRVHRAGHEHRRRHRQADQRERSCPSASTRRTTRSCWSPTSTRPASTSRCCTRCTWTSGSTACRRCRRFRGSTA